MARALLAASRFSVILCMFEVGMIATHAARILAALLLAVAVFGQGPAQQSGVDISGNWSTLVHQEPLRTASGMLGEYGGVPISEAGRLSSLAWDASRMTVRQQQCAAYVAPYLMFTGGSQRFWEERDPHTQQLVAIKTYGQITEGTRTIWMDGRPHPPPYAQHTWTGFSTGKYEGNSLTVYTTHMKRGWIRGNGMPESDQATLVEHFIRYGDRITYVFKIIDPVYLAEPLVRTSDLVRDVRDPVVPGLVLSAAGRPRRGAGPGIRRAPVAHARPQGADCHRRRDGSLGRLLRADRVQGIRSLIPPKKRKAGFPASLSARRGILPELGRS